MIVSTLQKMSSTSAWIHAMRLRTLPLAASVVLAGAATSYRLGFNWIVFALILLTTFLLQILSNLANDYGDHVSGADNDQRIGPARSMQMGLISREKMLKALIITGVLSLCSGLGLLWMVFGKEGMWQAVLFLVLGLICIWAAVKYTVGKSAYGYRGLGDLAVFLFFGGVGVLGTSHLLQLNWMNANILVATTFGGFSAAVLNVNNMRDIDNDRASGKNTLVVKIGLSAARKYHLILVTVSVLSLMAYLIYVHAIWYSYFTLLPGLLILIDTLQLQRLPSEKMDPFLKKTAIKTFLTALLFFILNLVFVHYAKS